MKKKVVKIALIAVGVLVLGLGMRPAVSYVANYSPNKHYFGDECKQVLYLTSISDYITAKECVKEADKALSTITNDETILKGFGELGYLCVTDEDAVSEKHKIKFVAADFSDNKGYIWVKYSSAAYDKNGEVAVGSRNVLSRWELQKTGDKWTVTSIKECP